MTETILTTEIVQELQEPKQRGFKCPARKMYELMIQEDAQSISCFHNPDVIFKNCRNCGGSGCFYDEQEGKDVLCHAYSQMVLAKAREMRRAG